MRLGFSSIVCLDDSLHLFLCSELDGVRISNLAKHRVFKPAANGEQDEEQDKEEHKKQDEFVLEKLFKKSGTESLL